MYQTKNFLSASGEQDLGRGDHACFDPENIFWIKVIAHIRSPIAVGTHATRSLVGDHDNHAAEPVHLRHGRLDIPEDGCAR